MGVVAWRLAGDWRRLPAGFFHLDPMPLAASWLVQTAGWLVVVDTWRRILHAVGAKAEDVPFARHLEAHTVSALANVLPGSLWMPAGRLALYQRRGVHPLGVSAAVAVEWLVVGVAGALLFAMAAPFARTVPRDAAVALAGASAAALAVLHPRVLPAVLRAAARRLGAPLPGSSLSTRVIAQLVGRELVVLALSGLGLYFLMLGVAPRASVAEAVTAWALSVAVANLLAWLPATLIIKDGLMALALVPLFGSLAGAIGVVVAWRIWMTLVLLTWAALAMALARRRPVATSFGGPRDADPD